MVIRRIFMKTRMGGGLAVLHFFKIHSYLSRVLTICI